jgi:hypothetical protein
LNAGSTTLDAYSGGVDVLAARSHNEAMVYVLLRDCRACGEADRDLTDDLRARDGDVFAEYTSFCRRCGNVDAYTFRLPERDPQAGGSGVVFGGDQPSAIVDAGQWLYYADRTATGGPVEPAGLTPEQRLDAALAMESAAAAVREVVKFIPSGEERVPPEAIWTDRGRAEFARDPLRLRRDRMAVLEAAYRDSAVRLAGGGQWSQDRR